MSLITSYGVDMLAHRKHIRLKLVNNAWLYIIRKEINFVWMSKLVMSWLCTLFSFYLPPECH